jgi:predicted phosphodiesterase
MSPTRGRLEADDGGEGVAIEGSIRKRRQAVALALPFGLVLVLLAPARSWAAEQCGTSAGYWICLSAPSDHLSGDVPISVTVSGSSSGISEMRFGWGSSSTTTNHLLSDFQAPWGFIWRTDRYLDATQWLNVRVIPSGGTAGAPVALQLALANGNQTGVPSNPTDWQTVFQPRTPSGDPVVAAVGDSGDGTTLSAAVASLVASSEASVLLYLGDLYERGTPAELDANYGRSSLEGDGGKLWGAMAAWTVPTLGNHEGFNIPVWRDYWHGRPDWDTFVFGGVRFLNLNSECSRIAGGCDAGSPQYRFARDVLAANTLPCVIAFWHKPVLSAVADTTAMEPLWALLASNGVDLVLNGHTHTMQRYQAMNASLQTGRSDSHMVQLISGAGGHNMTSRVDTDPRNAWQVNKVAGAAFITLVGGSSGQADSLRWEFRDTSGATVPGSEGFLACSEDTQPPTPPGRPTGTSTSPGTISLTWEAAVDDQASTLTYRIYRDGDPTPVGTVQSASTTTVSFTDTGLEGGSTHTYEVDASDGQNVSGRSLPSDPIAVMSGPAPILSDGFDSGLAGWTSVTNLSTDPARYPPDGQPPSVRAAVTSGRAFASRDLGGSYTGACFRVAVNVASIGSGSVALMKLRAAMNNASIGRVYLTSARAIRVRGDVSGAVFSPGVTLPSGWHTLELCGRIGIAGTWQLSLDGATLGSWTTDNGTAPITRVQLGDDLAKTVTVNFDDVVVVPW